MATETRVPSKCPECQRLTVDNKQHCEDYKSQKWANHCLAMTCNNPLCKYTYYFIGDRIAGYYPNGIKPKQPGAL